MALFQIVLIFGYAYSSGQHFEPKTFIAIVPMVIFAMGVYAILDHYGQAPSPRDLFSLLRSGQQ